MGLTLSLLIAAFVGWIVALIVYETKNIYYSDLSIPEKPVRNEKDSENWWAEKMFYYKRDLKKCREAWLWKVLAPSLVGLVVMLGCFYIGYRSNVATIRSYEAKIATYNAAIANDSIEGFEKLSLVENVAELNSGILQLKEVADRWYGFLIPNDMVNNLELIDLSKIE